MSEILLSAIGLHKTYTLGRRSLEVLRGVDVELRRGEFLALRGASGAGKSTLLHLLGGLDTPNQGEIRLAGRNLAALGRRDLARLRNEEVGFIFQA
jgi:ABC-type lipoprotein export system ATPase subunit